MSDNQNLFGKKIAILATDGFEQIELIQPKDMLMEKGAQIDIVSIDQKDTIQSWDEDNWGDSVKVDAQVSDVSPSDYDALILPGGQINPDLLRANDEAVAFIKQAHDESKVKAVAAICHGPWLLAESALIDGCEVTSFPSIKTDLINAGAKWADKEVVTDGKLVTSRNPDDISAFVAKITELVA